MNCKRILIILPNLDLGGAETVVMNYFRAFSPDAESEKIIFDFVVHGEKGFYEDEAVSLGARIFRAPTRAQSFFGNIRTMIKIYKKKSIASDEACFNAPFVPWGERNLPKEKYDTVVVCTEHAFAFIELAVAWFCGVKTRAAWSHFSDYQGASRLKRHANFFAQPFLRLFANLFLACTKDAAKWLFGRNFKKFHIVNNAMDLEKFRFCAEARRKIRFKHKLTDALVVGIVGRLTAVKNHAFALEVFSRLRDESTILLIVGDGELREEIESEAARMNLSRRVIFSGKIENVSDYYSAIDMLIMPSIHEGLPLVAIEAQAADLPVIMSTGIPLEAKISERAEFLPLSHGADSWAKKISEIEIRERTEIDLRDSGFDIESEAEKLRKIF